MNLTRQQEEDIENGAAVPVHIGKSECVVLRKDIYDRVKVVLYNDGELTDEEAAAIGWESGKGIGWDSPEMAEYDNYDSYRTNP